ncbi:Trypsin-related protease, partial [Operophtera brumata]
MTQRDRERRRETEKDQNGSNEAQNGRRRNYEDALRIRTEGPPKYDKNSLRIKGGTPTDTENFPYMAAVIINGRLWCAGAIVDENWVVTAAHCLNYVLHVSPLKSLSKYVKVRVSTPRAHEGGNLIDVIGAVRHPKFEEEPVPHADGSDTAFRDHTSDLITGRLKVRSQQYCIDAYQLVNGFQFTQDFFCASLRNGTRDACLQNRLMGIMSFGPEKCGHEFQPAVFIKAFYFREFVKHTIASYKTTADLIAAMRE